MAISKDKIEFIESHRPFLMDGDYQITVEQNADANGHKLAVKIEDKKFTVSGPRFSLAASDVYTAFPAPGSLGDHAKVIPHIVLNRSTLPWERSPITGEAGMPWLFLMVFHEAETPETSVVSLQEFLSRPELGNEDPDVILEIGQSSDDLVNMIDVPADILAKIWPEKTDLNWLAHCRQVFDENDVKIEEEVATIISNRLPKEGELTTVHLVSIENRFNETGSDIWGTMPEDLNTWDSYPFASLYSWSFACPAETGKFAEKVKSLNIEPPSLQLPLDSENDIAKQYLLQGSVPLAHSFRSGEHSASWYRGPLTSAKREFNLTIPAHAADELLIFDPSIGMFDCSYAAAWEMGRMLALKNNKFSLNLFNWKRAKAQMTLAESQMNSKDDSHLPLQTAPTQDDLDGIEVMWDIVSSWLVDLSFFKGLPFNYLVPDERMLPKNSIRFFYVDKQWQDCLLDGAFSIGRVSDIQKELEETYLQDLELNPNPVVTGVLIRSSLVNEWPDLLVDAFKNLPTDESFPSDNNSGDPVALENEIDEFPEFDSEGAAIQLPLLRMERLSDSVLICLFAGELKTLDIHQKPETLHFGVNEISNDNTSFTKSLRDEDGDLMTEKITGNFRDVDSLTISINEFANSLHDFMSSKKGYDPFTSAQFALEMIEGVQKVRFLRNASTP